MLKRAMTVAAGVWLAACNPAQDSEDMAGDAASSEPAASAEPAAPAESEQPAGVTPTPAPDDARVYFIEPSDGATVSSPVRVVFGLEGMGVAPAGQDIAGTGHHHLLIDTGMPAARQPIPSDDSHRHFGGGQTEAEISLEPGTHTLQLLLGDHLHVPHDPPIASDRITINVE